MFVFIFRQENDDTMVHFNLHFDPTYYDIDTRDVEKVLMREIRLEDKSRYFANLTVDLNSLDVQVIFFYYSKYILKYPFITIFILGKRSNFIITSHIIVHKFSNNCRFYNSTSSS